MKIFTHTNASHVTTNEWSIAASPDGRRMTVAPRGSAVVDQVVEVTHAGRTISRFEVHGGVTVSNADAISRALTVTTTIPGTVCDVADGVNRTVAAMTTVVFDFTCTAGPGFHPGDSNTTTSTASWQQDGVAHHVDSPAEPISWDGLYLHNTVDVQDIDGDELSVLGSLLVEPDGTLRLLTPESGVVDGNVARFSYRAKLDGGPDACRTYTRLAVVAGDDGRDVASDPGSVTLCARPAAPGLPHTGN